MPQRSSDDAGPPFLPLTEGAALWALSFMFFIQNSDFYLCRNKLNKICFIHRQILRDNHGPGNLEAGIMTYSLYTKHYSLPFLFRITCAESS